MQWYPYVQPPNRNTFLFPLTHPWCDLEFLSGCGRLISGLQGYSIRLQTLQSSVSDLDWTLWRTMSSLEDILNGPADAPPNGTTSNFDRHPPHNTEGYAVAGVCVALTTLAVGLRAYARIGLVKEVHFEDCTFSSLTSS